jgi:hypothetical protein
MRSLAVSAALVLALTVGTPAVAGDDHDHDHDEHKPPHGGFLLEVGDHVAHVEVVHDAKDGKVTLYVLDKEAKEAVKIKDAPKLNLMTEDGAVQVETKAVEADKEGLASQFEAKSDALKADPLKGRIAIVIGEKKYNVEIVEDEHDHDHK